ncbi:hypothetical protein EV702DRAFT_1051247 [Suillus placidus]|uniref:Uncharacterized protein n=1 Tax=Suillus placidus TaxID=48579 RepID=A0A9P6ZG66_9AGAM|nr:hypothetical protein EV702DRAFT_1051247 [Suillus placidus]
MARTKQTGPKCTGGPAKRGELPQFKSVKSHAGKTVIKTVSFKPTLPSSAKVVLKPVSHNIYCFFCRDGGSLYDCSKCPRVVCHKCIVIPEKFMERVKEDDVYFICPGCHESQGQCQRSETITPYFGFVDHEGAPVLTAPAVIHGHVEATSRSQTLQPSHSPAAIMRQELQPYRPDDILQYHEFIFDFGTPDKFAQHTHAMTKLVNRVKHTEYERVEIFIYTHSETVRGDLWGGFEESEIIGRGKSKKTIPGEPVAYSVDQFFAGLFVGGMEVYLKGATLWMLACGHTVRDLVAFKLFKDCVKRYEVEHAFAFGAESFHACLTTPFITTYVDRVLIEGFEAQEVMQDLLLSCPRLANHSSIIHLHVMDGAFRRRRPTMAEYKQGMIRIPGSTASMTVTTYTFFHENNRPFGKALPYQCSTCIASSPIPPCQAKTGSRARIVVAPSPTQCPGSRVSFYSLKVIAGQVLGVNPPVMFVAGTAQPVEAQREYHNLHNAPVPELRNDGLCFENHAQNGWLRHSESEPVAGTGMG